MQEFLFHMNALLSLKHILPIPHFLSSSSKIDSNSTLSFNTEKCFHVKEGDGKYIAINVLKYCFYTSSIIVQFHGSPF